MYIKKQTQSRLKLIYIFLLCCLCLNVYAQNSISGKVTDKKTGESLAFVNIIINQDETRGTTTDIDGKFKIKSEDEIQQLTLIYIGYTTKKVDIENEEFLNIQMTQNDLTLGEIVVIAGENPAHRIIRKAVENRRMNNPERVRSFKYKSYNKFVVDVNLDAEKYVKNQTRKRHDEEKKAKIRDQSQATKKSFDSYHLMIIESVTERSYIRPNKSEEKVLATRVSGLQNPTIAALATDIQPFSFYKSHIPLMGENYINPISRGSTQMYDFRLEEDTLFRNQDTIFVISFEPKEGGNFEGLKGVLYINTNRYAVQNVIAEPAQTNKAHLKIEQQYAFAQDQWFPTQLNFEAQWRGAPYPSTDMYVNGKSYFKDIEIEPDIHQKNFGIDAIIIPKNASGKTEEYWEIERIESLTGKEENSYEFIDSLGKEINLDAVAEMSENLITNYQIQFGKIALDIPGLINNNNYEGTRLGLSLHTTDLLSKYVFVGGYAGYGLDDRAWKYGTDARLRDPDSRFEPELKVEYFNDLREPGQLYHPDYPVTYIPSPAAFQRGFQASRMDSVQRFQTSFGLRPFRHAQLQIAGSRTQHKALYDYAYRVQNADTERYSFTNTAMHLNFRYAFKEQYIKIGSRRVPNYTPFPVLNVFYTRAWDGVLGGNVSYDRVVVALEADFKLKRLGETYIWLEGGLVSKNVPYSLLFNGNGSKTNWEPFFVQNTFQTMGLYEFAGDRFANLFVYHNFGTLLFRTKKFRPDVIISQSVGFSALSKPEQHFDIALNTLEKGYFESGFALDNLIRINLLNFTQLGLGAGVFYRYGTYHLPKEIDNYAFKFRAGITF